MQFITQAYPKNMLTDGVITCQYQDIPAIFESLKKKFQENGINSKDGVVLDCENSLPSALVLLFLLEHGYHFLLSKPENSEQAPPAFCRYQLKIQAIDIDPTKFLTIIDHHHPRQQQVNPEAKLYMRTSGSTGEPKIIVHSHAKMQGNMLMCVQRLGISADMRIAFPVPISHLFGLAAGFLPAVSVGASVDLQKNANIISYLQREKLFNPNTVFMTPVFCETLLKGRKSARRYKLTVIAGDKLREETFEKYEASFGCLVQLYGSTEMGAIAAGSPLDSSLVRSSGIGLPMPDVQIKIDSSTVEIGNSYQDSGEIWCKREYSFIECLDNQAKPLNLEQINDDGWMGTRDLGRILPNGTLEVLGRCDNSLKRDGLLVLFSDVETILQRIPGVESAAVTAYGESLRGKKLWAYCVISAESQLDGNAIRSQCFDLLPRRAVPDVVILVNTLPLLANGKLDRQALLLLCDQQGQLYDN